MLITYGFSLSDMMLHPSYMQADSSVVLNLTSIPFLIGQIILKFHYLGIFSLLQIFVRI